MTGNAVPAQKNTVHRNKRDSLLKQKELIFMLAPGLILLLIFRYAPMGGLIIAFKEYNIFTGIIASKWIGLEHFKVLLQSEDFYRILLNTFVISFYKIIFGFPAPILLALLLNEVRNIFFKRFTQNLFYLPHFLSWVVISGLCFDVFSKNGIINSVISFLGLQPIFFLGDPDYFRGVLVISDIWKTTGWGSIVYLAALTSIDIELYEAARMDGAGKLRQILHITLPGIAPVVTVMFILRLSSILEAGGEQILMMYNPLVMEVSDIIDTYVYRVGLGKAKYDFTTAVGLFKSVVGLVFVVGSNYIIKKRGGDGIW